MNRHFSECSSLCLHSVFSGSKTRSGLNFIFIYSFVFSCSFFGPWTQAYSCKAGLPLHPFFFFLMLNKSNQTASYSNLTLGGFIRRAILWSVPKMPQSSVKYALQILLRRSFNNFKCIILSRTNKAFIARFTDRVRCNFVKSHENLYRIYVH